LRVVAPWLIVAALAAGGCGDSETTVKNLSVPVGPGGFYTRTFSGISLSAPRDWSLLKDRAPLVVTMSSGTAVIALSRYPDASSPLSDPAQLQTARGALIAAAKSEDPGLQVIRSSFDTVDGDGAVEIDAIEQISGQTRRVRSMHIYAPGSEIVLEEYAPPELFQTIDHLVFSPVRQSLHLRTDSTA
jgi:hypothetical protein